jgi:hypothetical protein
LAVSFRELDVDRDADLCIRFRADSFAESFGSAERFFRAAGEGAQDYLAGLRAKNRECRPDVHVMERVDSAIC